MKNKTEEFSYLCQLHSFELRNVLYSCKVLIIICSEHFIYDNYVLHFGRTTCTPLPQDCS